MKTTLLLIGLTVLLVACGNNPQQQASSNQPIYDTQNPTTYQEYRKWRTQNDPAAERYAEYKRWEVEFRRWQDEQKKP